jgi:hypothetical protein
MVERTESIYIPSLRSAVDNKTPSLDLGHGTYFILATTGKATNQLPELFAEVGKCRTPPTNLGQASCRYDGVSGELVSLLPILEVNDQ